MTTNAPRQNYFVLLGLDPNDTWDDSAFQNLLTQKKAEWTRNARNPKNAKLYNSYLEQVPRIVMVMGDPAARRQEASDARRALAESAARRAQAFHSDFDLYAAKNFITPAEVTTLAQQHAGFITEARVRALMAERGIPETAPAASAPAAAAPPSAPVVSTAPISGFSYGGHIANLSDATIQRMREAGMTWIKKQVRYQPGVDVTGIINAAHGAGFRVLLGIVGDPAQVMDPGYQDAFAAYLGSVAAAGADAIEVWNEPNIDREWPAGSISPQAFTGLLRRAYAAIKAANPNTLVISGAPAPTGFFGGCSGAGCDDNLFIAGMAAAGAASYIDCVGIHYNEGIVPPSATSGDPRGSSGHYTRYLGSMITTYNRAFGGARPLCFTELGYLSPEGFAPLPGGFAWAENVTVAQQAAWLADAVRIAGSRGARLVIVWNVDFTTYGADPMAGYAMIRPDGSCPACAALGR